MENQPKTVQKQGAQGDVMFRRVDKIPDNEPLTETKRENGILIVTHSETGHHHAIETPDARLLESQGGLVAYLSVEGAFADVVHHRPWDTHETLRLPKGLWEVRRQREHAPEGWRRVVD